MANLLSNNYKNALFKIEIHDSYKEGSEEYNIKSKLALKCVNKFKNFSKDIPTYISYLLLYEVNGFVKVDWNKFLTIDATSDNAKKALTEAATETILSIEDYNPNSTRKVCRDVGIKPLRTVITEFTQMGQTKNWD